MYNLHIIDHGNVILSLHAPHDLSTNGISKDHYPRVEQQQPLASKTTVISHEIRLSASTISRGIDNREKTERICLEGALYANTTSREVNVLKSDSKLPRLRVAAIIFHQGKYLLTEEKIKFKNNELFWSIPGGGVDYLEYLESALRREVKEETGLEVEIVRFINFREKVDADKNLHKVTLIYLVKPIQGTIEKEPGKITNIGWFTRGEALKLNLSDNFRKVLQENPNDF